MSAGFESCVVLCRHEHHGGAVRVDLSTRPQARARLWLLGWIAILIHFTAPLSVIFHYFRFACRIGYDRHSARAGTFFLLSVSEVFIALHRRLAFVFAITSLPRIPHRFNRRRPAEMGFYRLAARQHPVWTFQAVRFYGWRSPYLYALCLLLPYAGWVIWRATAGDFWQGLYFYMFGFFAATGLAYYRHFSTLYSRRYLYGGSFLAWGCVPPVGNALYYAIILARPGQFLLEPAKFFVAFGMILTLLENQTEVANTVARQYQSCSKAILRRSMFPPLTASC